MAKIPANPRSPLPPPLAKRDSAAVKRGEREGRYKRIPSELSTATFTLPQIGREEKGLLNSFFKRGGRRCRFLWPKEKERLLAYVHSRCKGGENRHLSELFNRASRKDYLCGKVCKASEQSMHWRYSRNTITHSMHQI